MGVTEEAGKVTESFIDALKKEPLSLALVLMNLALLMFFWVLLSTVAAQREREVNLLYADHKEVRDLLAKCVVPSRSSLFLPPIIRLDRRQ
jgi:hypothetical protein